MRIPESKIAEIAAAADIVQVISNYVELKKAGKDYRGVCPFHGDKDPSLYVSPQKSIFHCFGCAVGGSVFNFIMRIENLSFVEAAKLLAQRYSVVLQLEPGSSAREDAKERLYKVLALAHSYFIQNLRAAPAAQEYLLNRGLGREWIDFLGLGFAPDSWDGFQNHLSDSSLAMRDALNAGLVRQKPSGGYYDYFRGRIMIPIRGLNGELVAFGGRAFGQGDPKYLNSPESPIFKKKNILFGLDTARDAIKKSGFIILVEGYFDQISLRIRGIQNVVAPLGTSLTTEHAKLLKRFSERVVTIFDGDEAGLRAVKRSLPIFLSEGIEPECVILTEDKDPDAAINRIGTEGFNKLIESSDSVIDFFLNQLESQYDFKGISGRNQALEECIPILRQIADSSERDYLIERFSSRIRINEERIRRAITTSTVNQFTQGGSSKKKSASTFFDFPAEERNVVRGMLIRDGFVDTVVGTGVLREIENPTLSKLAQAIIRFSEERGSFDSRPFALALDDPEMAALVASWLQPKPEEDDLRPEVDGDITIDQSLERLRLKKLLRRKSEIQEKMRKCEAGEEEYNNLARELLGIGRRLQR
ncbi:MAG: DNA primase [Deltaproteobacteria bacterium]|nr:DNA primase [Deltaproteobacteria bacterium]